jgi:hypothetical protein
MAKRKPVTNADIRKRAEAEKAAGREAKKDERLDAARRALEARPSDYPFFAEVSTWYGRKKYVPCAKVHEYSSVRVRSGSRHSNTRYVYRCSNGLIVISGLYPSGEVNTIETTPGTHVFRSERKALRFINTGPA